jgi:hypothetical protein
MGARGRDALAYSGRNFCRTGFRQEHPPWRSTFSSAETVCQPLPRNPRATTPTGIYDRPQVGLSVKQIIGLIDDQGRVFAINRTVYAGTSRFDRLD